MKVDFTGGMLGIGVPMLDFMEALITDAATEALDSAVAYGQAVIFATIPRS